jgi:hypothetical protein
MKHLNIILILITLIAKNAKSQTSTLNIPNYKLETIEKTKLGLSKEKFLSELKLLKIKNQDFSTNLIFDRSNVINFYYSQSFNFDEFKVKSKFIEHPSLIHSESIDNKTISSIILLLGHTGKAVDFNKEAALKENFLYFRQDINQDLFFKIVDLYILKYGEPEMIQDSTHRKKYYMLYKNKVIVENSESYKNYIMRWKTEFFNIEIFPGFDTKAFFSTTFQNYSTSSNWVSSNLREEPLEEHEKPCFTFPYVKYELNERALRLLAINKLKI